MPVDRTSRLIAIVDDDEAMQDSLRDLMEAAGLVARCFGSAEEFLESDLHTRAACLIVDIRMPKMSGLQLQARLKEEECNIPIIFITAHGDARMRIRAMREGAVEFLAKLFGHEKGAFTGAIAQKIGRFEMADNGTLFLDEVGDIPPALQPKLLRVLQEQEFERLGSGRTHKVDVRLVAATNRDLVKMVARGQFRSDLYYRLNVFPILLPALRERREDIPALVTHFVKLFSRRMGKRVDSIPLETIAGFQWYLWPGNIRELQNLVERAVILSWHGVLQNPLHKRRTAPIIVSLPHTQALLSSMTSEDSDRALIVETLEQA